MTFVRIWDISIKWVLVYGLILTEYQESAFAGRREPW